VGGRSLEYPEYICQALFHYAGTANTMPAYPKNYLVPYLLTVEEAVERIVGGEPMPSSGIMQPDGLVVYGYHQN